METKEIYQLPAGVSGFFEENVETPKRTDVNQFRKCCENLAENSDYQMIDFFNFNSMPTKSYHLASFKHKTGGYILIFCNRYFPLVAFSQVADGKTVEQVDLMLPENEFFDDDLLDQYFKNDFEVLSSAYLGITVDADNIEDAKAVKQLTFYEFAEFSFWKPQVLADIVFNNWG